MTGSADDAERLTSEAILSLLDDIDKAVQQVKLYVADALLRPPTEGTDRATGG